MSVSTDPFDFEEFELGKALGVVSELRSACVDDWTTPDNERLKFWDNAPTTIDKFKADKVPHIHCSAVEAAVGNYLALPYRCKAMDRLLIRILIGMGFYTFGNQTLNGKNFARSPRKQPHELASYLIGLAVYGVLFGGIALLASWLSSKEWISGTVAGWTAGICVFLFLLFGAIRTVALPFAWARQAKARKSVLTTLMKMSAVYEELRSDGPISVKRIYDRVSKTSEEGVVWPTPVFAFLDDVMSRTQSF